MARPIKKNHFFAASLSVLTFFNSPWSKLEYDTKNSALLSILLSSDMRTRCHKDQVMPIQLNCVMSVTVGLEYDNELAIYLV